MGDQAGSFRTCGFCVVWFDEADAVDGGKHAPLWGTGE